MLAERNLPVALEDQGVRISRPHRDAPHVLEVDEIAPVGPEEAVRCQPVLQSIKPLGYQKFPGSGNDYGRIPNAGAVPDILNRHEADFVLMTDGQNDRGAPTRGAGCIGADARHLGVSTQSNHPFSAQRMLPSGAGHQSKLSEFEMTSRLRELSETNDQIDGGPAEGEPALTLG